MRLLTELEHKSIAGIAGVAAAVETSSGPCDKCGAPMVVQKTIGRRVATLTYGIFQTRETVRICKDRCTYPSGGLVTRRSEALQEIVPLGGNYGYDVEVFVGLERFVCHHQREEIRRILQEKHGILLSTGEISVLAQRFLHHLEQLHLAHTESIRQVLAKDGGYPLHIDATGEDGKGTLFVAYAGWREWVLGVWKIPTERADVMLPHLRNVVRNFGEPRAIVRDLGRAATRAVAELVSEMKTKPRVLACHQHFLRDVGKDLLRRDYEQLRHLFRNFGVRSKLRSLVRKLGRRLGGKVPSLRENVETWAEQGSGHPFPAAPEGLAIVRALGQWALDYTSDGRHQGFPFDRPYLDLFNRCCTVYDATNTFQHQTPIDRDVLQALNQLSKALAPVNAEVAAQQIAKKLEAPSKLFDELRAVLRLDATNSPATSPNVVKPDEQAEFLQRMEACFSDFSRSLQKRRAAPGLNKDERRILDTVLSHLKRHGPYLWGHVLQIPEEAGGGIRVVDRTNNILEGFFHQMKHCERRRSGRKVLTQDFEGLPAAAALAYNLTRPDYVQLVCGSLEELSAQFSALDLARREAKLAMPKGNLAKPASPTEIVSASLPLADRRLIRKDAVRDRIRAAANVQQRVRTSQQSLQSQAQSLHNIEAKTQSETPSDGGSRFIIYLPRRRGSVPTAPADASPNLQLGEAQRHLKTSAS